MAVWHVAKLVGSLTYQGVRRAWLWLLPLMALTSFTGVAEIGLLPTIILAVLVCGLTLVLISSIYLLIFYRRTADLPKRRAHILSLPSAERATEIFEQFDRW